MYKSNYYPYINLDGVVEEYINSMSGNEYDHREWIQGFIKYLESLVYV